MVTARKTLTLSMPADAGRCMQLTKTTTPSMTADAGTCLQLAKHGHCRYLRVQAAACSSPNVHAVVACGCRPMPDGRKNLTLSTHEDARRCFQLAKPSHCQCLRMQGDACSSPKPPNSRCVRMQKAACSTPNADAVETCDTVGCLQRAKPPCCRCLRMQAGV